MKKLRIVSMAALLLTAALLFNSCYGPFRLTSKLYTWNGTMGSKWANEGVFFAFVLLPVYSVAIFLDAIIFNSIEFWGGTNPISMEEGEEEMQIVRSGNKEFLITATKNKFRIEQMKGDQAGETAEIIFAPEENSCYLNYMGQITRLVEYVPRENGADRVNLFMPDGSMVSMDAGERNMEVIQMALKSGSSYLAEKEN